MSEATKRDESLLLLPALSFPMQRSSLIAAYKSTLDALLPVLVPKGVSSMSRLDVGVVVRSSHNASPFYSRSETFPEFQKLLANVYSVTGIVAAQRKLELDFPGGIDVRVFVLEVKNDQVSKDELNQQSYSGPVVDVRAFVSSSRSYKGIYTVEGEVAGELVNEFVSAWQSKKKITPEIQRLPCGPAIISSKSDKDRAALHHNATAHRSVAVGGTFDHLHIGHKLLLTATIFLAEPNKVDRSASPRLITVGITGNELLKNKKFAPLVESWEERQQKTAEYVESILVFHSDVSSVRKVEYFNKPGPNGRIVKVSYGENLSVNYTEISDPFGPTITDENISALVISQETRAGGQAVNDKRKDKGWSELEVFEIGVLDANPNDDKSDGVESESFDSKISSTEIRRRLDLRFKSRNGG